MPQVPPAAAMQPATSADHPLLEHALRYVNDVVLITDAELDPPGPRILFANDAFARMTGYRSDDVLGAAPRLLQGERTDRRALDRIRAAMAARRAVHEAVVNYRRSGEAYLVELDIVPVFGAGGDCTHFVSIQRDVTERREVEERLRRAQHLQALGQLTGGVAHDFNNLLTVIVGNADLLTERLPVDSPDHELAQLIAQAAGRAGDLTHRLLAFGRRQALSPEPVDVDELIVDMGPLLRHAVGDDVAVEHRSGCKRCAALADRVQLESAVLNLCVNARDAMPQGGQLVIATRCVQIARGDEPAAELAAGEYVLVEVSDTGTGIPPEILPRVFEPYFTTKPAGEGTGLGLAMVYGFSKQSGGHVALDSGVGRGTTVRLYLPRAAEPAASAAAAPRGTQPLPAGLETVLVVEDDALVRRYATERLRAIGYRVFDAASGPEALALLAEHPETHLLFTDVLMPGGVNGRQLAERAVRLFPHLKVLFASGYALDALLRDGRIEPGIRLLQKPYRPDQLASAIRAALDDA